MTGSGKSRLLEALHDAGAQVLDLERIAQHRGSVLGGLPDCTQPSQKMFESGLWDALASFDSARPVFVECESKRIGAVQLPDALMSAMRESECIEVHMDQALRARLLLTDYSHFVQNPDTLDQRLECLLALHGRTLIERWKSLAHSGEWQALVEQLLERHYDPAYRRSIASHYVRLAQAQRLTIDGVMPASFASAAAQLLEQTAATGAPA
jgi:tRNA 2-selenouridine synthase